MDCATALEAIQDAMDGRLDAAASAALDAHVAGCPACAEERRAYAGLRSALRALPAAKAPQGFADGVMAGVARAGTPSSRTPAAAAKPKGRILRVRFALAAAAVAAAVVVVAVSTGGPQPSGDDRIAGAELARNAATESADPLTRAKRILDERVSGSGAPSDDAAETQGEDADAASEAMKSADAAPSAPSPTPASMGAGAKGDTGEADEARDAGGARAPAAPAAPGAAPPGTGGVAKAPRGRREAVEQEKGGAPTVPNGETGPTASGAAVTPQVVYAVFATETDALAFVEGLSAAGVATSEPTADRKDAAEAKDKRADGEPAAPGRSGGISASGGGGGGGVGGQRAASGAHGFGRGGAGYLELRRLSIGAMTAERRAVVDRAASAARGRLTESLVPQGAREPSDPPAPPRLADVPATPGGDAGGAPAKRPPAERAPAADADAQRSSLPSPPATKAPAEVTLVIVVGAAPAPAGPTPPTKR